MNTWRQLQMCGYSVTVTIQYNQQYTFHPSKLLYKEFYEMDQTLCSIIAQLCSSSYKKR
jgi:hypothetical protein